MLNTGTSAQAWYSLKLAADGSIRQTVEVPSTHMLFSEAVKQIISLRKLEKTNQGKP